MGRLGLSGRAFIPMILGFGCSVPALMASRVLENQKDRYRVMLVTPFMSCSARLPIYILFSEMFFGKKAMIAAYSMYVIGLFVAIGIAAILHLADKEENPNILLIELPEYKAPSARTVAIYVWEKVKDFVTKAGTTIFLASVIMWFILNFGPGGYTTEMEASFGAVLGKVIVPFSSLWPGLLADRHGAHRGNLRQRGGCHQLCRAVRNLQHQFPGGYGAPSGTACCHGLWRTERLLPDDFLSALHPLRGNPCYD